MRDLRALPPGGKVAGECLYALLFRPMTHTSDQNIAKVSSSFIQETFIRHLFFFKILFTLERVCKQGEGQRMREWDKQTLC